MAASSFDTVEGDDNALWFWCMVCESSQSKHIESYIRRVSKLKIIPEY